MKKHFLPFLVGVLLSGLVFLVYWFGLAPGPVWEPADVGTLLASLVRPKFFSFSFSPFYFIFGSIWSRWGSLEGLAFRANLISSLLAALGVVLIYLVILKVTQDFKPALFGGLCLALFPGFWYFALFANFYILSFSLLWLSLLPLFWFEDRPRLALFLSSFFFALSFSCFPSAISLVGPLLAFIWMERRRLDFLSILASGAIIFLVLAAVFLTGVYFGLPLREFLSSLLPLRPIFSSSWQNILCFAETFLEGSWWLLLPLAGLGLIFGGGERKLLSQSLISLIVVAAIYPLPAMTGPYLPFLSAVMIWASFGFDILWNLALAFSDTEIGTALENRVFVLVFRLKREGRVLRLLTLSTLVFLMLVIPFWAFPSRFSALSRRRDIAAELYGETAWEVLPPGAVVLSEKEEYLSILRYFEATRGGEGVLVTHSGLGFDEKERRRILRFYSDIKVPQALGFVETSAEALAGLREFVAQNPNRAFFFTLDRPAGGRGNCVGEWEGLSLTAEEPLYRVER